MKKNKLFSIVSLLVIGLLLLSGCGSNQTAQTNANDGKVEFTKPISIVIPSSPGASIDVMARIISKLGDKYFGTTVTVLNKTGGSGNVALAYTQSQPANGYTIHGEATGITSVLQLPGAQYTYKDFIYVSQLQNDPFVLYVGKDSPYKTIEEFIAAAKEKPGELTVGGYGTGTPHHIFAETFAKQVDIKIKWISFDSGNDALVATMGGHLDATLSNASLLPSSQSKVIALAVSSHDPLEQFPDIPTFASKDLPDLTKYHWRGILVKKDTPENVVKALDEGFKNMTQDPEWKKYIEDAAMLEGYSSTEEFTKMVYAQADNDLKVLKEIGLVK
ncbi:MAG: Bug family tripartite tricarboxylate transporter substrate binding protein [Desulfitobacterium sp.]